MSKILEFPNSRFVKPQMVKPVEEEKDGVKVTVLELLSYCCGAGSGIFADRKRKMNKLDEVYTNFLKSHPNADREGKVYPVMLGLAGLPLDKEACEKIEHVRDFINEDDKDFDPFSFANSIVDEENAYLVPDEINGLYNSIIGVAENAVALLDRQLIWHFKKAGNEDYEKYGPKRIVVFNNPQSSPTNPTSDTEREI